jgi:16S rRNA (guanine527-N7)-methyltransferase
MFNLFCKIFPDVSRETLNKICEFYALFIKWNMSHKLMQSRNLQIETFERRHLIDCWQIVNLISQSEKILDIGSGGGFPGILLAIAERNVTLCETDKNKVAFLSYCRSVLNLQCDIENKNAFQVEEEYDALTSRAFTSLDGLLQVAWNVSRETKIFKGLFLKGKNVFAEIEEAKTKWNFDFRFQKSVSSAEGCILTIKGVEKR